jgi:WD40 repeat protein
MNEQQHLVLESDSVFSRHSSDEDTVLSIAVSGDGRYLATGGGLDNVYIWDRVTRRIVRTLVSNIQGDYVESICHLLFHFCLPYLARIETDGTVTVTQVANWTSSNISIDLSDCAVEIAFDPVRPHLLIGCYSGQLILWDIVSGIAVMQTTVVGLPVSLSISHDSCFISAITDDGLCTIISIKSGSVAARIQCDSDKFEDGHFSPLVPLLVIASLNGKINYSTFDFIGPRQSRIELHETIWRGTLAKSTPLYAIRSTSGTIAVLDYLDDSVKAIIQTPRNKLAPMCFGDDSKYLFVGGDDRQIHQIMVFSGMYSKS